MPLGGCKQSRFLIFVGVLVAFSLCGRGLENTHAVPHTDLHSVRSVVQLTSDSADLHFPVVLRAQVLLSVLNPNWLFVQDGALGLFVAYPMQSPKLTPGDWVEIAGSSAQGGFDPIVRATSIRVIEHRPLPAPLLLREELPNPARISNVLARASGLILRIHTASSFDDSFHITIQLRSGILLGVAVARGQTCDSRELVLSQVDILGVYGVRWSRGSLFVADCSAIRVLQHSTDLWNKPPVPIVGLLTRQTGTAFGDVVHLRGTVTAFRPQQLFLQQGKKGISVEVSITDGFVAPGKSVDVIGRLSEDQHSKMYLAGARVRSSSLQVPVETVVVEAGTPLDPRLDATLIEAKGSVSFVRSNGRHLVLKLGQGPHAISATLPFSTSATARLGLGEGDSVTLRGILTLVNNPEQIDYEFELLPRSIGDLQILKRRAWTQRIPWQQLGVFLTALAVLALLVAAIIYRRAVLRSQQSAKLDRVNQVLTTCLREMDATTNPVQAPGVVLLEIANQSGADLCYWFDYLESEHLLRPSLRVRNGVLLHQSDVEEMAVLQQSFSAGALFSPEQSQERGNIVTYRETFLSTPVCAGIADWFRHSGQQANICFAVRLGHSPIGLLTMSFKKTAHMDPIQRELILTLANHLALAVHLTQLYEKASLAAVLEERNRIAREIHDSLTQCFTGILMQLQAASSYAESNKALTHACLGRAESMAREGLREARQSVMNLVHSQSQHNLPDKIHDLIRTATTDTGTRAEVQVSGHPRPVDYLTAGNLLRICQEALSNAQRYAKATRIDVGLSFEQNQVVLEVADNGVGFQMAEVAEAGFGLAGMRARAARLNGDLKIESRLGQGTSIAVAVPIASVPPGVKEVSRP